MNNSITLDRSEFLYAAEAAELEGVSIMTLRRKRVDYGPQRIPKRYRFVEHPGNGKPMYFKGDLNKVDLPTHKTIAPGRGRKRKIFASRCHANGDAELNGRIKATAEAQRELTIR